MLHDLEEKYSIRRKFTGPLLVDVNPNYLSILALFFAFASGYMFYRNLNVLAGVFLLANGYLDILDGEVAKEFGRSSKFGDFIDHTFDRIADLAMLLGLALGPVVPLELGGLTAVVVLLVSYMGTQHQAISQERLYGGLFGRSDRIAALFVFSVASYFFPEALLYGVYVVLILSAVTFIQRFHRSAKEIRRL
ncbi:MAG: CDP-alcohol phosphatidyltransferase family protein [Candidatus Aenigmatarchaeota archaeon]